MDGHGRVMVSKTTFFYICDFLIDELSQNSFNTADLKRRVCVCCCTFGVPVNNSAHVSAGQEGICWPIGAPVPIATLGTGSYIIIQFGSQ